MISLILLFRFRQVSALALLPVRFVAFGVALAMLGLAMGVLAMTEWTRGRRSAASRRALRAPQAVEGETAECPS